MAYRYIIRAYGTGFAPGDRVVHSVTGVRGVVLRVKGDPNYYRVRHDGQKHGSNWHPQETLREVPT